MLNWLQKLVFGSPAEATETKPEVSANLVRQKEDGSLIEVEPEINIANIFARSEENDNNLTSGALTAQAQAQNTALFAGAVSDSSQVSDLASRAQTSDQDPIQPLASVSPAQTQAQNTALVAGAGAVAVSDSSPAPDLDPEPASASASALDLDPDQTPTPALVIPKAKSPVLNAAPTPPDPNLNNTIIDPIINLVDSIFTKDNEDPLKKYFFSIFIPPEDDDTKKSTASTPSPAPTITPAQEAELRETLEKCANAYISGDTNLPPSGPIDPQSGSTKTTSKSSQILKEKAEPPVYFGVGIKTELAEAGDEKFLKITEIFDNSNLRKKKQGNVDYTNQFITHLNCKLGDDTEAREYSITDIFNKFRGDPNQKEKFDEKIDQIFRDISQTSIKFKISADKSQPALAEVNIDKIIFEKTPDGAYKQKTTTPSPITEIRDATGKGVEAGLAGVAV